jgi:hypothetical protein
MNGLGLKLLKEAGQSPSGLNSQLDTGISRAGPGIEEPRMDNFDLVTPIDEVML